MRVFYTTSVDRLEAILRDGFDDLPAFGSLVGVWLADCPLDINDGFAGNVRVCLDVPEELFRRYEVREDRVGYRHAIIPAGKVNRLGRPEVYDHEYTGCSRLELIKAARSWEEQGAPDRGRELRDAVKFFDSIGWLAPVKVREGIEE